LPVRPRIQGEQQEAELTDIDQSKNSTCSFESMQLNVGERLQLELMAGDARKHYYTTLIGFVPGHSVLVRTPLEQNLPIPLPEGAGVLVRTFSGRHAFTLESRIDRVCRSPYPYMHLAYPAQVRQTLIRGELRVRVMLPGIVSGANEQSDEAARAVVLSDLSVSGALLETDLNLGQSGTKLGLVFKFVVQPNNYEVKLATSAQIQSMRKIRRGRGPEELFSHGVRFGKLHATEGLLLQSYIQQVLLSDRSRVV
jgi:Flagellar protein YcgR